MKRASVWLAAGALLVSVRWAGAETDMKANATDPPKPLCEATQDGVSIKVDGLVKRLHDAKISDVETKAPFNTAAIIELKNQISALRALETSGILHVNETTRVAVQLTNPPSNRLRVSFDTSTGLHREVDWDPAVSSELVRHVSLEDGDWTISASVDPYTFTQQSGVVVIQTRFASLRPAPAIGKLPSLNRATLTGTYVAAVASGNVPSMPISDTKPLDDWPHPQLTFECGAPKAELEKLQFAAQSAAPSAGLRGFGVAPTFVTDTMAILTEIAMERAKSGAMRLIKQRIVEPFCSRDGKMTLRKLQLGGEELAFPRTCALLDGLRLEDILSSGRALLSSLRDDLRGTIATAALSKLGNGELTKSALVGVLTVINTAIDRGGFDGLESQLVLEQVGSFQQMAPALSEAAAIAVREKLIDSAHRNKFDALRRAPLGKWTTADPQVSAKVVEAVHAVPEVRTVVSHACQARLAVAVIKRCSASACSVREISDAVGSPKLWLRKEESLPLSLCWSGDEYLDAEGKSAEVKELVLEGLKALSPVVDAQGRDRAKAAVRLIIRLAKRWKGEHDTETLRKIDAFGETAIALIDEDYGTALTRALDILPKALLGDSKSSLTKMTRIFGAVAAYATVYRATKDEDPKAAHEARKKALTSIIDSATDRSEREKEGIVSLGSNVGLSGTWTYAEDLDESYPTPGVRIPLAVRVEWWPSTGWSPGGHIGLQVFDLGQFVRRGDDDELAEVEWADFVSPGLELGVNLGFIGDRALNLSFHSAYAPSIEGGAWRFGAALSYYVPFFDFN